MALLCVALGLLFLAITPQAKELSFKSEDDLYSYRSLTLKPWTILGLWTGVYYHSVEVEVNTKNPKADGNFIWGSIYVGTASFPVNWQGYFSASAEANRSVTNPDKVNWETFDVSWTSSFIACAYLRITEKNSTDDIVTFQNLNLVWSYDTAKSQSLTNVTAGIYVAVFDSTLTNGAVVTLQYIATAQSGILDVLEGVRVVPKGIETLVGIEGWPYANADNTLTLSVAVGTRDVTGRVDGQLISTGTSDEDSTFFRIANNVSIDGNITDVKSVTVTITRDLEGTFGKFSGIPTQLRAKYHLDATVGIFNIEFPAGAKSILYDPTMGSGSDPFVDKGSNVGLIVGVTVGCVLALLLVVAGLWYFVHYKRADYQQVE